MTVPDPSLDPHPAEVDHDLGIDETQRPLAVPGGVRLDVLADNLHVLLRNTRSPRRLRHGFQRNAVP